MLLSGLSKYAFIVVGRSNFCVMLNPMKHLCSNRVHLIGETLACLIRNCASVLFRLFVRSGLTDEFCSTLSRASYLRPPGQLVSCVSQRFVQGMPTAQTGPNRVTSRLFPANPIDYLFAKLFHFTWNQPTWFPFFFCDNSNLHISIFK